MSAAEVKRLRDDLMRLNQSAVRQFYDRAYRECRIINSSTFPSARAIQELVQAWKALRRWRR